MQYNPENDVSSDFAESGSGNIIEGTAHADVLVGSSQNDFMYGRGGDDRYIIESDGGKDVIVDSQGNNVVLFAYSGAKLKSNSDGNDLTITATSPQGVSQQVVIEDYHLLNKDGDPSTGFSVYYEGAQGELIPADLS